MSCQQVPAAPALNPYPRSVQVGEFEVAIDGGIWVAIRGFVDSAHNVVLVGGPGTGKTTTVPMRRLSDADKKYVEEVIIRQKVAESTESPFNKLSLRGE